MSERVVHLAELEPGIVRITLEDRAHKNAFSDRLLNGIVEAFAEVAANPSWKAVILTGYDTYFCTGGTQDMLLKLSKGEGRFTDFPIYNLPLTCEIPVIAAMQGHAVGGGLALGLFADFVVLSRESVYTANFMKYGFTPGFGSTLVMREKLGLPLAQALLMTAANYRGDELARHGIAFPVLPRAEVAAHALDIARQLADKPRHSLVTLKAHLNAPLRAMLPEVTAREVEMHERTFPHPEVQQRIRALFGS
ncbi:polyketide biosynthesis enoyl-CoA hydratase [Burkholderia gladioli]|uniref:polyketide synthase n=1 Tax=Burkholderia gladioli TaxID=28095 RepID=UPI00050DB23F|nr:polyketide synthase [Burkholderia gladioli]KGE09287.1 polyketide biosynthesis enoyl-CoA hydratase [Burkholderia gladioli]